MMNIIQGHIDKCMALENVDENEKEAVLIQLLVLSDKLYAQLPQSERTPNEDVTSLSMDIANLEKMVKAQDKRPLSKSQAQP